MTDSKDTNALERENAFLRQELELFRGVFSVMKEDLNVKNEQIEHIYNSLKVSMTRKAQEQEANEKSLQKKLSHLECVLRAKDVSYARVQKDLQRAHNQLQMHFQSTKAPFLWCADELAFKIFSYLDVGSVYSVLSVQRAWYDMVMLDDFWEAMYARRWCERLVLPKLGDADAASPDGERPEVNDGKNNSNRWLQSYKERHVLERNWTTGKAVITTLCGHNGTVTCLEFDEDRLISGSDDGSLMLWTLAPLSEDVLMPTSLLAQQHHRQTRTVQKLHSFYGHGGPVWALHMHGNTLMSGSYDKTIKLWNLQTGSCFSTLRAHTGWVSSLDASDARIASGSWDSSVNIWDLETGELVTTFFDEPANPIYCLKWEKNSNAIVTGCRRRGIQVWDAAEGRCIQTFAGHSRGNQVNGLQATDRLVLSGGSDATIKIWDRRENTCASTLAGHTGAVMCVDMRENFIISGSYDTTIKLWDMRRPSACVQSIEGHSSAVFALQMDHGKIISGSADTTLKIFNFLH
ncbi:Aste57867_18052 [Aphanomyces stellatus]|uniref:Aste57867_18052 protein n=1 Tax=Aphanomyces stellatus TaxID=120398 RepID=A0A485L9Q7_9STRA|nr:hypothetical protein As57867_017990 [Aphanomyces stellatus]VFT94791.1 Aste57867_18052 [Aphanomyces stellatus]